MGRHRRAAEASPETREAASGGATVRELRGAERRRGEVPAVRSPPWRVRLGTAAGDAEGERVSTGSAARVAFGVLSEANYIAVTPGHGT
jgi:hypothetical protein